MENTGNISLSPESPLIDNNPDNNRSTEILNVIPPPSVSYNKVADASEVAIGDTVTYTVTVTVADAPLSADLQVTDTLGVGLQFVAVTDFGDFTCNNSNPLVCALPTGTGEGTYSFTYTALVTEDAETLVSNSVIASGGGDATPVCDAECAIDIPVLPQVSYNKVADPADSVEIGDTITYTFEVKIDNGPLTQDLTLEDTLGVGLVFDQFTSTGPFNCAAGTPLQCVLPAGTAQGTYSVAYTATVTGDAGNSVMNDLVATGGGGSDPVCDANCSIVVPVQYPGVRYNKSSGTTGMVDIGDQITYTVSVTVDDAALIEPVEVVDELSIGLDFVSFVGDTSPFNCSTGNPFTCTLPAGTEPGVYEFQLIAEVNDDAANFVVNSVIASGGGGPSEPVCESECSPSNPLPQQGQTYITYEKFASPDSVQVGEAITYTVEVTVSGETTFANVVLEDTLGAGLELDSIDPANTDPEYDCEPAGNPLQCILPSGTGTGTYTLTYTATVTEAAGDSVNNALFVTGGSGGGPDCIGNCSIDTPVVRPAVIYSKAANPSDTVIVGDEITYTITVDVDDARLTDDVVLEDTLGPGQDFVAFSGSTDPFTCATGNSFTCTLPAGSAPGSYVITYTATVNNQAQLQVENSVTATGNDNPQCDGDNCETVVPVQQPGITYSKSASPDQVVVGGAVTYTVTVNISGSALTEDIQGLDTLGAGLMFDQIDSGASSPEIQCAEGNPLTCSLPAGTVPGTYQLVYTADVTDEAGDVVSNSVTIRGDEQNPPVCSGTCATDTPVIRPTVTYEKAVDQNEAEVGDTLTYTVNVKVDDTPLLDDLTLRDNLGNGLRFEGFVGAIAPFTCDEGNSFVCILPEGTEPGIYLLEYTATIIDSARETVVNSVVASIRAGPRPTCSAECVVVTDLVQPQVSYAKSADHPEVKVGDIITYSVNISVSDAALTRPLILDDVLGLGLEFNGFVSPTDPFTCGENPPRCSLPVGTDPGEYTIRYTVRVTEDAQDSVVNSATATGGGGNAPVCNDDCDLEIPVKAPDVSYNKTADKDRVQVGDTVTYTATITVANAATRDDLVFSDALGVGLEFDSFVEPLAPFSCNEGKPIQCMLPAGTESGTYTIRYTATVTSDARDSVTNTLRGSGDDNPVCDAECELEIPLLPTVLFEKSTAVTEVQVGDVVTYTVSVEVINATLSESLVLTDTAGTGLSLIEVTDSGEYSCNDTSPLVCTLPPGTVPGTYTLSYTARVTSDAAGEVDNLVVADGNGGSSPECKDVCAVSIPVLTPQISVSKVADPQSGTEVAVGDPIAFTIQVDIENSALTDDLVLADTPSQGLSGGPLPEGCTRLDNEVECVLPEGTPAGTYQFKYVAEVDSSVGNLITNTVVPSGGGDKNPECSPCRTEHPVRAPEIRLTKTVSQSEVQIGEILFYTLLAENVGSRNLIDGVIVDTPAPGFSYVDGSLRVRDLDDAGTLLSTQPLVFGDIDIAAGESATIIYGMRVGASVRSGVHTNRALVQDGDGNPVSNEATASVVLAEDPLLDESLIIGRVFHDRNGNGRQENASLSGVRVRGGFPAEHYIPGSTAVNGIPVPDASAPLLRGIELGTLSGRIDGGAPTTVVVSQRLTELAFTHGFRLTSNQGYTLILDGHGELTQERTTSGDGFAAQVTVERRTERDGDGYLVEYTIRNYGINEEGLPGVRITSVNGLMMITDQFGRYHLVGVHGGDWGRGRNFILKLDPATLPIGARITTDNPLVRRITPGIPVRFDFGVKLPARRESRYPQRSTNPAGEGAQ